MVIGIFIFAGDAPAHARGEIVVVALAPSLDGGGLLGGVSMDLVGIILCLGVLLDPGDSRRAANAGNLLQTEATAPATFGHWPACRRATWLVTVC